MSKTVLMCYFTTSAAACFPGNAARLGTSVRATLAAGHEPLVVVLGAGKPRDKKDDPIAYLSQLRSSLRDGLQRDGVTVDQVEVCIMTETYSYVGAMRSALDETYQGCRFMTKHLSVPDSSERAIV